MKKLFTLMLALIIGFGLKAQCPLTQAVDFTATDCHGTEVHLFDILDGGQHVLIDFFYTTCGPCQQATPKVVESYYAMGCNMHDVYYMEITCRASDTDDVCLTWCQTYGVEYPTISGPAGGVNICNQYGITAYPTVILIAPNRQILIQDLWPINNAQSIISALEAQGLQQHDCNEPTYDPQVTITVDQILETEVTATFTPNDDCASYAYTMATESEIQEWMSATGLELPEYLWNYGIPGSGTISNTFNDLTPDTEYIIFAVPADINGNLGEVAQEPVTTTPGSSGDLIPDFIGNDIEGNEIHLYDILDGGQAAFLTFFLTYDPGPTFMPFVTEAYSLFGCNENDVFFLEFCPNAGNEACAEWAQTYDVKFPTISRDGGSNAFAQSIPVGWYPTFMVIRPDRTIAIRDLYPLYSTQTIIDALEGINCEQHECFDGVDQIDSQVLTLFPNPANESVLLSGENLSTVRVYNTLGQMVDAFETNGTELRINTTGYENGIYFVKTDEKTLKFIVKH